MRSPIPFSWHTGNATSEEITLKVLRVVRHPEYVVSADNDTDLSNSVALVYLDPTADVGLSRPIRIATNDGGELSVFSSLPCG